jgi:L-ascorbate 6-phosphate lactonase
LFKITWLGQAGLLFDNGDVKIIVDPYLSDSVRQIDSAKYRRMPVNEEYLSISPDVLVLTHNHLDHTDSKTLTHYLGREGNTCVLAPKSSWDAVRTFGNGHNYVMFNRHTQWTHKGICFTAVKAEHSDDYAIGVIIDDGKKKYYVTGDTLYNTEVLDDIPKDIDVLFLPINGEGNNMNMTDAARFADVVGAKTVVPIHWGMFDEINPNDFECKNKVILEVYKEMHL